MNDREVIRRFNELSVATLVRLSDGWWAYHGSDQPIGPFATKAQAARVALQVWDKK
jgi:hypothetical protein